MPQAHVERATGRILFIGSALYGSNDPNVDVVTISDESAAVATSGQPGEKILDRVTGKVTVLAPTPIVSYSDVIPFYIRLRTTDGAGHEIWRLTLDTRVGCFAIASVIAVDSGNGNVYTQRFAFSIKRLNGAAILIGAQSITPAMQDVGTTTWSVVALVSGNDFVVNVAGATGRTIDWMVRGEMTRFGPNGLVS